ncbi:MAG TPA: ABC transporter permease [Terriglobales bacterium]
MRLLFHRDQFHHEMEEEIGFHVERLAKELEESGLTPEEARREARLRFGNLDSVAERTHESAAFGWESVVHDLRYAMRVLRKNRILSLVVVASLALGIGANVAIFTVMNAVMLRMLPVREPERLVVLNSAVKAGFFPEKYVHDYEGSSYVDEKTGLQVGSSLSTPTYETIRGENTVFEQTFAFAGNDENVNVGLDGRATSAKVQAVSGNYFEGLGVTPVLGRAILQYDDSGSAAPVAIASYRFWVNELGADRSAIGKRITINDTSVQLIGVAPPEFFGMDPSIAPDFWLPLSLYRAQAVRQGWGEDLGDPFTWWLTVVGRLKPEVTRLQAAGQVSVLFARSIGAGNATAADTSVPALRLDEAKTGLNQLRLRFSEPLWLLMAMVGVLLLIACANVAALLLARATARQKEIATRMSLGARRSRVVRQLLTESLLLSLAGGLCGLMLSPWLTRLLVLLLNRERDAIGTTVLIDWRVLAFAMLVSIGTGLIFGLAPALRASSTGLAPLLKQNGAVSIIYGKRFRVGKLLVGAQVALCVLLLVAAGLLVRTLRHLQKVNLGFNNERVVTFVVRPGVNGYSSNAILSYYEELMRRVSSLPGVRSATYAQFGPIGEGVSSSITRVAGYTDANRGSEYHRHIVGDHYFETLQIPVLLGRAIGPQDTHDSKSVVVINETAVREIFHGDNPLGRQMVMGSVRDPKSCEVVGVVGDVRYGTIRDDVPVTIYFPVNQIPRMGFTPRQASYLVRSSGDLDALFREITATALELNSTVPIVNLRTEDNVIDQNLYLEQTFAILSSVFAATGLLLACIGLYGTITYTVSQRTNEIGVRLALGAGRENIVAMVLREALLVIGVGAAVGIPIAWISARVLTSQLYGLGSHDWKTLLAALVSIVAVTLVAGFIPARKASRTDPLVALRYE